MPGTRSTRKSGSGGKQRADAVNGRRPVDLRKQMRNLPSRDPADPSFRRLRYIRYADDHLLGFTGPKAEAGADQGRSWAGSCGKNSHWN